MVNARIVVTPLFSDDISVPQDVFNFPNLGHRIVPSPMDGQLPLHKSKFRLLKEHLS
jgi:hypothetical protein